MPQIYFHIYVSNVTLSMEQDLGELGDIHFLVSYPSVFAFLDNEHVLPF